MRRTLLAGLLLLAAASGTCAAESDTVERGRYLAVAADCTSCHTNPDGGKPFAGGYAVDSPLGTIYSSNITPSKTSGIGTYTETQFARALRQGVRADGRHLYPAMPYTAYVKLTDDDIAALYAYFLKGVQPVDFDPPETDLPFPFNQRVLMRVWNALFLDDGRFEPDQTKSSDWNRGAYLAEALAHCGTCHTPRNILMAEKSHRSYAGGPVGPWYAPNITADPHSGAGDWSQDELVRYFRTGDVPGKAQAAGGMAEAISNSLQYLIDEDVQALATYVRTIPPIRVEGQTTPSDDRGSPVHDEVLLRGNAVAQAPEGALLYSRYCASCHQPSGAGTQDNVYPSLFDNTATGGQHADNLIAAILYGVERRVDGHHVLMPRFDQKSYVQALTTSEIVTLSNYVLTSFGNPALQVTTDDVEDARNGGAQSVLAMIALPLTIAVGVVMLLLVLAGILLFRRRYRPASH